MSDWRNDIEGFKHLDDLDFLELLIHMRNRYLGAAKDLLLRYGSHGTDVEIGERALDAALGVQAVIEAQQSHG